MPPLNHNEAYFNPEAVRTLASALDNAWDRIAASGGTFARPSYARAAREVLAHCIIEMAQAGETDMHRLADASVLFLVTNYSQ